MSYPIATVTPEAKVLEALKGWQISVTENKYGLSVAEGLLFMEEGALVGIVTSKDLLKCVR